LPAYEKTDGSAGLPKLDKLTLSQRPPAFLPMPITNMMAKKKKNPGLVRAIGNYWMTGGLVIQMRPNLWDNHG